MIDVSCQHCGEQNKCIPTGNIYYRCWNCKNDCFYREDRPNLFYTKCNPCKLWIGHEKYMTSIDCHYCGLHLQILS